MATPWTVQRAVDENLARALIESQFPELKGLPLRPFGQGWDNVAYLLDERWVFRFPQREVAAPLMKMEILCLPLLAGPGIPSLEFVGMATAEYPWPFAGYEMIRGQTLERAGLAPSARGDLAADVGRFLSQLHACPAPEAVRPDPCRRLDRDFRRPEAQSRLAALLEADALPPQRAWEEILGADWREDKNPVLLHGDLYSRHLVVSDEGRLSGVIDWGDLCIGSRAIDLCVALTAFEAPDRQRLIEAYGEIDDELWPAAFFRALTHGLALLAYAHDLGDQPLIAETRASLERVAQGWQARRKAATNFCA